MTSDKGRISLALCVSYMHFRRPPNWSRVAQQMFRKGSAKVRFFYYYYYHYSFLKIKQEFSGFHKIAYF